MEESKNNNNPSSSSPSPDAASSSSSSDPSHQHLKSINQTHHNQHHAAGISQQQQINKGTSEISLRALPSASQHGLLDLPQEVFINIVRKGNLNPNDLFALSRVCSDIRGVLLDIRTTLFEDLITHRFDPDLISAYRTGHSPFHISSDSTNQPHTITQPWGPAVLNVCFPTMIKKTPPLSPTRKVSKRPVSQMQGSINSKGLHDGSPRRTYHDLDQLSQWMDGMTPLLINEIMRSFLKSAERRLRSVIVNDQNNLSTSPTLATAGFVLGRSWEAAAAAVLYRRRRVEAEELSSGDGRASRVAVRKVNDAMMRLRVQAVRAVVLLFAVVLGCKKECEGSKDSNNREEHFWASDSRTEVLRQSQQNADTSNRVGQEPITPTLPPLTRENVLSLMGDDNTVPEPQNEPIDNNNTANMLALVPVLHNSPHGHGRLSFQSRLRIAHWRRLRTLDTDALTGMAVALRIVQRLLVTKFLLAFEWRYRQNGGSTGSNGSVSGDSSDGDGNAGDGGEDEEEERQQRRRRQEEMIHEASLRALHAVAMGPFVVGRVIKAGSLKEVSEMLECDEDLRIVEGPFFGNAVVEVLRERDVDVEVF
ncbi:hypothetical protein HDU76_012370 [Blyttiomyces sp. JEL0837]|nr:hypothetical protein HDU76_012370 [Blyttiomyces sp. JEL0837]